MTDACEVINNFLKWVLSSNEKTWYRGHSSSDHVLLPSLYRLPQENGKLKRLLSYENSICTGVESELAFNKRTALSEWEVYFEARHSEAPSRLLDFTGNALIALFFAVHNKNNSNNHNENDPDKDAIIFRFDPLAWNFLSLPEQIEGEDNRKVVYAPDLKKGNFVDAWGYMNELDKKNFLFKGKEFTIEPKYPIAIYPPNLSARMKIQQSMFLIFGSEIEAADKIHKDNVDLFDKFEIPSKFKAGIYQILRRIGYTEGIVYQTLDNIVKDLIRSNMSILE
jgi:hypothetical protein